MTDLESAISIEQQKESNNVLDAVLERVLACAMLFLPIAWFIVIGNWVAMKTTGKELPFTILAKGAKRSIRWFIIIIGSVTFGVFAAIVVAGYEVGHALPQLHALGHHARVH